MESNLGNNCQGMQLRSVIVFGRLRVRDGVHKSISRVAVISRMEIFLTIWCLGITSVEPNRQLYASRLITKNNSISFSTCLHDLYTPLQSKRS